VLLAPDACASYVAELHEAALRGLGVLFAEVSGRAREVLGQSLPVPAQGR